ncbi:MAG TPA: glycosyltransferase family 4 protein [Crinalium sp.]|jgi:glycosyltransferase involved in cell wall biosynthesis
MKVLLSAYECEPNRGREQGRGWNWALQLAKLGYEVWVLTPQRNQDLIEPAIATEPVSNLHFVYIPDSAFIRNYITGKKGTVLRYLLWQKQAYDVARQLDQEHNFDLVHHLTMGTVTGGSWLWRLRKPFVYGPAGGGQVAPPILKQYFYKGWNVEALRSFIMQTVVPLNPFLRDTFKQTDLVLAANSDTVELMKNLGAPRAEFFADVGIPDEFFQEAPPVRSPSSELRLFWVARMYPRKALLLALEALSKVNPAIPVKLVIAGGGEQQKYLAGWIEEFGLQGKVEFLGFLSWEAVREQYLKNDAMLFTSLRDTTGAQLLEAMAQAMPIITLDHHGAKDSVPANAGIKIPIMNPTDTVNAMARAIEYMYEHPEERLAMGQAGYEYAKTQTWTQKVLKISKYYEDLASKKPRYAQV